MRWRCGRCGAHGLTRIESRQVWHRCNPPKRPRRRVEPRIDWPNPEEARASVWRDAFADALGIDPTLRPLEEAS